MDIVKKLELDLWEATEKQNQLQKDLNEIILENENYRKLNNELKLGVNSSGSPTYPNLSEKELSDKLSFEKKRHQKTEKELELFKSEFDNQLSQQLELAVADARAELHLQIEKTKQIAEDQSKVYDELESYKLQLTAAEQIITENSESKRQGDLEIARLRGGVS